VCFPATGSTTRKEKTGLGRRGTWSPLQKGEKKAHSCARARKKKKKEPFLRYQRAKKSCPIGGKGAGLVQIEMEKEQNYGHRRDQKNRLQVGKTQKKNTLCKRTTEATSKAGVGVGNSRSAPISGLEKNRQRGNKSRAWEKDGKEPGRERPWENKIKLS